MLIRCLQKRSESQDWSNRTIGEGGHGGPKYVFRGEVALQGYSPETKNIL